MVSACSALSCSGGYTVVVRFAPPTLAVQARRVELSLVQTCLAPGIDTGEPVAALRTIELARGATHTGFGNVQPGTYGLYARAFGPSCGLVGTGCAPVTFIAGGSGERVVVVHGLAGPSDCPSAQCVDGACLEPDAGRRGTREVARTREADGRRRRGRMERGADAGGMDASAHDAGGMDASTRDAGGMDASVRDAGGGVDAGTDAGGEMDASIDAGPTLPPWDAGDLFMDAGALGQPPWTPLEVTASSSCPSITACGGDVVGTWDVSGGCFDVNVGPLMTTCPTAMVSTRGRVRGRFTFDGTTSSRITEQEADANVSIPASCLGTLGDCSNIATGFRMLGLETVCAVDSSGGCQCAVRNIVAISYAGTYSIMSNQIVTGGETWNYCVTGTAMTYEDVTGGSDPQPPGTVDLTKR